MMPNGWQLVILVLVLVMLFGATKLPQLARSMGQSARVFKAETRGLQDDEQKAQSERSESTEQPPQQLPPGQASPAPEEQTKRNEQTN